MSIWRLGDGVERIAARGFRSMMPIGAAQM
jgi:hypothetical protein